MGFGTPPRSENGATTRGESDEAAESHHAMIRIDHMNDSMGYLKTMARFCDAEGLGCRVFHTPPTDVDGRKRVEGVFVALSGSNEGIKSFLCEIAHGIHGRGSARGEV